MILIHKPFQMQQHGGLAELGSSIEQNRLAPEAAAEEILCEPGTGGETGRAEDRCIGDVSPEGMAERMAHCIVLVPLKLQSAFPPKSTYYEQGKFGRMFPMLPPFASDTPTVQNGSLKELV